MDGFKGKISFVGAGPGDPDLLTVKALKVLAAAEVILYDSLVSEAIMGLLPLDAELIPCGRDVAPGADRQERTNALLVEHALAGRHVVRLKGGDPTVFGRLGEEIASLRQWDIPYEIIPGVNSALAAAAAAGIPLTHRDWAPGLTFISGHPGQGKDERRVDQWRALVENRHTLAIFMGSGRLREIAAELRRHLADDVPIAVIERATLPDQHITTGPLATFAEDPPYFERPALILVGHVVSLLDEGTLPEAPSWWDEGVGLHVAAH